MWDIDEDDNNELINAAAGVLTTSEL